MIPLKIEGSNMTFTAPEGQPEVRPLHCRIEKHDETLYVFSRWEPTPDELELLNAGGSVELRIMGCQPPVSLVAVPHSEAED